MLRQMYTFIKLTYLESVSRKVKYKKYHSSIFSIFARIIHAFDGFELCARKYKKLKNDIFSILPYVISTLVVDEEKANLLYLVKWFIMVNKFISGLSAQK